MRDMCIYSYTFLPMVDDAADMELDCILLYVWCVDSLFTQFVAFSRFGSLDLYSNSRRHVSISLNIINTLSDNRLTLVRCICSCSIELEKEYTFKFIYKTHCLLFQVTVVNICKIQSNFKEINHYFELFS